jgi:hypothetical protein
MSEGGDECSGITVHGGLIGQPFRFPRHNSQLGPDTPPGISDVLLGFLHDASGVTADFGGRYEQLTFTLHRTPSERVYVLLLVLRTAGSFSFPRLTLSQLPLSSCLQRSY